MSDDAFALCVNFQATRFLHAIPKIFCEINNANSNYRGTNKINVYVEYICVKYFWLGGYLLYDYGF